MAQPIPGVTVCAFCKNCFCNGSIKIPASDGKSVHMQCKDRYEQTIVPPPPKQ